ncbi:hypothetical protein, partial [Paenibacillus antri]|uniref:hypothetical protein n=1 Tax=Paenibacillus antri TaxID=2582848 RepID=UPI001EE3B40B
GELIKKTKKKRPLNVSAAKLEKIVCVFQCSSYVWGALWVIMLEINAFKPTLVIKRNYLLTTFQ